MVQNSKGVTGYTLEITPTRASPCLAATSSEGTVVTTFLCSLLEIIYAQINTYKLPPSNGSIPYVLFHIIFSS